VTLRRGGWTIGPQRLLLILSVICFVLVAIGIDVGALNLTAVGLALGFASFLV
jgi:hypothetical protein